MAYPMEEPDNVDESPGGLSQDDLDALLAQVSQEQEGQSETDDTLPSGVDMLDAGQANSDVLGDTSGGAENRFADIDLDDESFGENFVQGDVEPDVSNYQIPVNSMAGEPVPSKPALATMELPTFATAGAGSTGAQPDPTDMARVRDIPLEVTVELGRTRLLIRDILDLSTGSIIELDKIAGEPVDLFANGLLVARGEVVVIDDNFGVRVTEIITAAKRVQAANKEEADALAV